jgi:hypothetical protein
VASHCTHTRAHAPVGAAGPRSAAKHSCCWTICIAGAVKDLLAAIGRRAAAQPVSVCRRRKGAFDASFSAVRGSVPIPSPSCPAACSGARPLTISHPFGRLRGSAVEKLGWRHMRFGNRCSGDLTARPFFSSRAAGPMLCHPVSPSPDHVLVPCESERARQRDRGRARLNHRGTCAPP